MNRETSLRMNSPTTANNGNWETPPEVFKALHAEFRFDIDLCGGPGTQHRLPLWFGPGSPLGKEDALSTSWYFLPTVHQQAAGGILSHATISGFCNPVYGSFIPEILEKAYEEAFQYGFTSVFLLPNRATKWYKRAMRYAAEIRIVDERIAFWEEGHPRWNAKILREEGRYVPDPAMFDSCVVVVKKIPPTFQPRAAFDLWHWDPVRWADCRLTVKRRIVRIDRSPMNERICLTCGHEHFFEADEGGFDSAETIPWGRCKTCTCNAPNYNPSAASPLPKESDVMNEFERPQPDTDLTSPQLSGLDDHPQGDQPANPEEDRITAAARKEVVDHDGVPPDQFDRSFPLPIELREDLLVRVCRAVGVTAPRGDKLINVAADMTTVGKLIDAVRAVQTFDASLGMRKPTDQSDR